MSAVTKLKCYFDLNELKEFYEELETKFQDKRWDAVERADEMFDKVKEDYTEIEKYPSGWALQSYNNRIMPPWNVVQGVDFNNETATDTEMMFGLAKRLSEKMPFLFRISVSLGLPGQRAEPHRDKYPRIHVPIYSPKESTFDFFPDKTFSTITETVHMEADGFMYFMDARVPHGFYNNSTSERRVHILASINPEDIPKLYEYEGQL